MEPTQAYDYYQIAVDWLTAQPLSIQIAITVALAGLIILTLVGVFYLVKYIFLGLWYLLKGIAKGFVWLGKQLFGQGAKPEATAARSAPAVVQVEVASAPVAVVEKRFCAQCGHELAPQASFCAACGSPAMHHDARPVSQVA